MPTASARAGDEVVLDLSGLQALIDVLLADGRTVVGPTVRDGAITYAAIESIEALPRGVGDEQDAGHYRLRERGDARPVRLRQRRPVVQALAVPGPAAAVERAAHG